MAFDQPSTLQAHQPLSPSTTMKSSLKISKGLASQVSPDSEPVIEPAFSQTSAMENSKPRSRHSKHKIRKQPKSSRIPDPPPRGTFSTFSYSSQRSSPSINSSSSGSRPSTPVLSITEIELLGHISVPAPYRLSTSRGQQRPEPPMSAEEWRKATEWRRAHKFERALRIRERISTGEKENGGMPAVPLDVACEMVSNTHDDLKGEAKRQALARILEPPLARAARIRTMSWVDSPPPTGLDMEMEIDAEGGVNPNSSPDELSVDEDAGTVSEIAGKCKGLKLSGLDSEK